MAVGEESGQSAHKVSRIFIITVGSYILVAPSLPGTGHHSLPFWLTALLPVVGIVGALEAPSAFSKRGGGRG